MKKKDFFIITIVVTIIVSVVNLGFNIYFLATMPKTASGIFHTCKDSIVEIKAESEAIGTNYGTGVIINFEGFIITNAHVITYTKETKNYSFQNISVRFVNEENYRLVEIVKYDLDKDIALLKLNDPPKAFTPIKIGNDLELEVGDIVYALGNMSNYGLSLTIGNISIPHVNITYNKLTKNVIQCNLTISEGNSGGALLNSKGELIGITTFRLKDNSNNIIYGIAYCIPITNIIKYVLDN